MPPAPSPGLLERRPETVDAPAGPTRATAAERASRVRFRRALALMAMTLVAPGSAQLSAGNRRVGRIALRVWLTLLAGAVLCAAIAVVSHSFAFWVVSTPWVLLLIRALLTIVALGWGYLLVDAWRLGQPLSLGIRHRRAVVGVNGVLCLSIVGSLLFGAHLVGVQRDFIQTLFSGSTVTGAHAGRFNVLLLGGDSGAGRWGLRPDSMTVASIDASTGRTVLISLPRNMKNFPFAPGSVMAEQFPQGFDADYLNGVSTWAEDHTDLFPGSEHPGVDATIMGIEGITGLTINYWAMVNLEGFKELVDAVGGVTLNVRQAIPVGGLGDDVTGYIKPGVRTLNGHDTLWFARARDDSDDYSRMARQKCVMSAMLSQISPQTALRNFQSIASASAQMISTNVPASEVDRFIDLALKAKSQKISTLSLVPPMINTGDPDIDLIHTKVAESIDRAEGKTPSKAPATQQAEAPAQQTPSETPAPSQAPTEVTGGSLGSLSDGYAANEATDLGAVC